VQWVYLAQNEVRSIVAVAEIRGHFANQEKGEHLPSEAVTRRLVKTVTEDISACKSDMEIAANDELHVKVSNKSNYQYKPRL
jgi:hypothetical protein